MCINLPKRPAMTVQGEKADLLALTQFRPRPNASDVSCSNDAHLRKRLNFRGHEYSHSEYYRYYQPCKGNSRELPPRKHYWAGHDEYSHVITLEPYSKV